MNTIDLRSDTVTKPTPGMRKAMYDAEVGDDVYNEDPTIQMLERIAAEKSGMEAAVFASSGTQSNLMALLSHCQRGDEYIVGQMAHTYHYEAGGAAVLGSIQPQPLDFEADGTLDLDKVAQTIKPDDFHFPRSRLLCIENTNSGRVLPLNYLRHAHQLTRDRDLGLHLDGARVFNAAVKDDIDVREITRWVDSVSICLSKGLGAPIGSVLCGPAEFIHRARRWRKMLGGGMRQAGVIAAAGLYALENHVDRLHEDHENARSLAAGLAAIDAVDIDPERVQTNMVFVSVKKEDFSGLANHLRQQGIILPQWWKTLRLVTHLDIQRQDVERVIGAWKDYYVR